MPWPRMSFGPERDRHVGHRADLRRAVRLERDLVPAAQVEVERRAVEAVVRRAAQAGLAVEALGRAVAEGAAEAAGAVGERGARADLHLAVGERGHAGAGLRRRPGTEHEGKGQRKKKFAPHGISRQWVVPSASGQGTPRQAAPRAMAGTVSHWTPATGRSRRERDSWLCVPASRRVCLDRNRRRDLCAAGGLGQGNACARSMAECRPLRSEHPPSLEIDLGDVGPEEQRHRPVEHDPEPAVPARHLQQVVGPPEPPRREAR